MIKKIKDNADVVILVFMYVAMAIALFIVYIVVTGNRAEYNKLIEDSGFNEITKNGYNESDASTILLSRHISDLIYKRFPTESHRPNDLTMLKIYNIISDNNVTAAMSAKTYKGSINKALENYEIKKVISDARVEFYYVETYYEIVEVSSKITSNNIKAFILIIINVVTFLNVYSFLNRRRLRIRYRYM